MLLIFLFRLKLRKHDVALADPDQSYLRLILLGDLAFLSNTWAIFLTFLLDLEYLMIIDLELAYLIELSLIALDEGANTPSC
jgi:hypothetical protein